MAAVELTEANNGESIEVHPGDEIILHLPENPTTGYRWHIERADGMVEVIARLPVDSPPPDPGVVFGRGGVRSFDGGHRHQDPGDLSCSIGGSGKARHRSRSGSRPR
jgi:Predicted secreted protein